MIVSGTDSEKESLKLGFAMPHMVRLKAMTQPWEAAVTGADQTRLAKWAEQLGYEMISIPEHYVIPNEHVDLSGPHHLHAYTAMSHFAGATETIRVNSCISILPLQNPLIAAKALSTMDWLSSGRVTVTFAVGWLEGEFDALGVDFHQRGAIMDEYLEAIVELWTSDSPAYHGRFVSFDDVAFEPRCVQQPHLPIWIGGDADRALSRAARHACGWWPFLTPPESIPEKLDFIRSRPDYAGRLDDVFYGISTRRVGEGHAVVDDPDARPGQSKQEIIDRLGWFSELGVTCSAVPIPALPDFEAYFDYTQWVAEEIMPVV